jgi:hypothetical protein
VPKAEKKQLSVCVPLIKYFEKYKSSSARPLTEFKLRKTLGQNVHCTSLTISIVLAYIIREGVCEACNI